MTTAVMTATGEVPAAEVPAATSKMTATAVSTPATASQRGTGHDCDRKRGDEWQHLEPFHDATSYQK